MRLKKQRGFALITLIIAMVLMAALGAGIYTVTTSSTFSELLAGRDYNAYQLAKAGARFAASLLADNPSLVGTYTYYMPDANHSFTISITPDPLNPGHKNITSRGNVNPNTFLAAVRQLAFNLLPSIAAATEDTYVDPTKMTKNAYPGTVIGITPDPGGDISKSTIDIGAGTGQGGTAPDSYGSIWYNGARTNGNCVDGICDFGFGLNAFFKFQFLLADTSANSTDYADGFTFAVMSAINNTKNRTGGAGGGPSEGELLGYGGPGNTIGMAQHPGEGLVPPKMALEFDTFPDQTTPSGWCAAEGGTCSFSGTRDVKYGATVGGIDHYNTKTNLTSPVACNNTTFSPDPIVGTVKACYILPPNICAAMSRYDQSVKNHAAIVFWGDKTAAGTNCTGVSNSYDDNMHGAGTAPNPQNSVTASQALGESTGYYQSPSQVTWMEDGIEYSVRIEIGRTDISGGGNYGINAWIVRSDSLTDPLTQNKFQDVTVPLPSTVLNYNTSKSVTLYGQDHSDFSKIFFGFTEASGTAAKGGQKLSLKNLKVFFPQQAASSPCSYTLTPTASPTHPAAGGSFSVAVGTASTCFWEASIDTTLYNWISFAGSGAVKRGNTWYTYGQGNGTVNYTVAENTSFSTRSANIIIAGQSFTVTQAARTCLAGQFLAEYFNDTGGNHLSGTPVFTTCENAPINWSWGTGGPGNGIGNDNFSARWTGQFPFSAGVYTFIATADDGVRVNVDGTQIINGWVDQGPTAYTAYKTLTDGSHTVVMEYYEHTGGAVAQLSWQSCPAISITTTSLPDGARGTAYSQQLAASASNGAPTTYTWAIASGTLPAGLTLSSAGVISGTPTVPVTSTFTVQATGNCSAGQTTTQAFTLTIGCPAITITTASLPSGTVGTVYTTTTLAASAANGAATTYTWAIASGTLPTGLTLTSAGVISGTPTGAGGSFSITVRATGNCSAGQITTKAFTLTIGCPAITITTASPLTAGTVGTAYSQTLAATPTSAAPYTWTIDSGALPTGLTLSSAGVISGTPTGVGGGFNVTVRATGNCSSTITKAFTLTINCPVISISTASLPNGTVGTAYSQTLAATPTSAAPYTWAVTVGTLPTGLTLNADGSFSGTPTSVGTSTFTVRATGNCSSTITKAFTLTITKGTATVTLSNLSQTYTGSALTPTATTTPGGLTIVWIGAPQTTAGTYTVTATINDTNYQGSASGSFVINKAAATVTLSNLTQTYTGSALTPTATTAPAGLTIVWTNAPQTNAGTYTVTATVNNTNYQGSASGSFVINKATATVTLSNMTQTCTGSPLTPTATTNPVGRTIVWTNAPQTNVGSYSVTATISDTNYQGSASGSFVINKGSQTITVTTHAPAGAAFNSTFTVAATASSNLPVAYSSGSTNVCTNNGATFTMNAVTGTCVVQYDQAGDTNYNAATRVTENTTVPKCSGGNSITTSGGKTIHTFTSSGTLSCNVAVSAGVLIVAGGGGGGGGLTAIAYGGGGGAGGLLEGTLSLTAVSYTVTVGAGGAGVLTDTRGNSGGNSVFSTYTANGGGGGGARTTNTTNKNGLPGGSGGGGGGQYSGAAGSANQGSSGTLTGYGRNGAAGTATYLSGGGGGAGGAASGGTEGPGRASSISGTSITYAVGGNFGSGVTGAANTGNGGGGNAAASGTLGSAGGSGIVIISY
jgi:hypothetical protein